MKFSALIGAALVATAMAAPSPPPTEEMFQAWMKKYNKEYSTDLEYQSRFINYQYGMQRAEILNQEQPSAHYGETKFMDLSFEEFQNKYLTYRPAVDRKVTKNVKYGFERLAASPDSWNWASVNGTNFMTPVKDQGDCGSCWAFSSISNIESQAQIATGKQYILSTQQQVSCETTRGSSGCAGGWTEDVMDYVTENGSVLESQYPYTQRDSTCDKTKIVNPVVKIRGYARPIPGCFQGTCLKQDENLMADALASAGPLSICVNANNDWMYYQSGVMTNKCAANASSQNHCVQASAFIRGKEWTIRNSWGTDWGEKGFMRLPFGTNACGLADDPIYALI